MKSLTSWVKNVCRRCLLTLREDLPSAKKVTREKRRMIAVVAAVGGGMVKVFQKVVLEKRIWLSGDRVPTFLMALEANLRPPAVVIFQVE
jgi:hypothetical protein